jgi:hypothetical protein
MLRSLRRDDTERIIQILSRVCRYRWFSAEFRAARGFEWLIEKFPATKKNQAATVICLSLDFAEDELDIVNWIEEFYELLLRYKSIGGFQEPEMFADAVTRVYSSQIQYRETLQSDPAIADRSSTPIVPGTSHAYMSNWSEEKWDRWSDMVEQIFGGLRRGYLRIEPSQSASRFVRDPDGCCSR